MQNIVKCVNKYNKKNIVSQGGIEIKGPILQPVQFTFYTDDACIVANRRKADFLPKQTGATEIAPWEACRRKSRGVFQRKWYRSIDTDR